MSVSEKIDQDQECMSQSQDGQYQKIGEQEIRILCLEPGHFGSPLTATLEITPLRSQQASQTAVSSAAGRYEAISYAWGPNVFDHEIHIRDRGSIPITVSLHGALQRFRLKTKIRRLWADAVCINQSDDAEKSTQVALMHLIYNQAKTVLVWLGEAQESDAVAFATLDALPEVNWHEEALGPMFRMINDLLQTSDPPSCPCCKLVYDYESDDDHWENWEVPGLAAVAKLLERPWLKRLWVAQETASQLAQATVFSGSHYCPLEKLVEACDALKAILSDPSSGPEKLEVSRDEAQIIQDNASLLSYELFQPTSTNTSAVSPSSFWRRFGDLSRRDCKDPRDRVFAIRNVTGLGDVAILRPDYSLSAVRCYEKFTYAMIDESNFHGGESSHHQPWTVLALAGTESTDAATEDRPSWVPYFHLLTDRSRDKLRLYSSAVDFSQLRSNYARFKWRQPKNTAQLELQGMCWGTLDKPLQQSAWPSLFASESDFDDKSGAQFSRTLNWYLSCKEYTLTALDLRGTNADLAFHDLLTCGELSQNQNGGLPCVCGNYGWFGQYLHDAWASDDSWKTRHHVCHFIPYLIAESKTATTLDRERLLCHIHGNDFEDVGWVPASARAGDQMCVIGGAPYPFVVRPMPDGSFKLLGDAYTISGTLRSVLGGGHKDDRSGYRGGAQSFMSWEADNDMEMSALMDRLGWISLS